MFDFNILLSWNQSINEWIEQLYVYIEQTDYYGLYILGEKWTILIKELGVLQTMNQYNIEQYEDFIKFIDHTEEIVSKLNKITNGIITKEVTDYTLSSMGTSYKNNYDNIIKKIIRKKVESDDYLRIITDSISDYINIILKQYKSEKLIEIYESSLPHGSIIMEIHLAILKKYKKIDLLEPYKRMVLGVIKEEYIMNRNIHPIQKINYLIEPFISSKENKKGINISISNQTIDYDINPLISRIDATKFGPIANVNTGLNKQLINRFKTIKVSSNIVNNSIATELTTKPLNIYTGSLFKEVKPINFKEGYEWQPMNGVDPKTYKYNSLLESVIFKNMTINNSIYKSFTPKDYSPIVPKEILNGTKKSVSEICYEELEKFLSKKLQVENINITREMYLSQFFNINKIIESIRKGDEDSIEIIPLSKSLAVFKLI